MVCSSIDLHITFTNVETMKDHLKFGLDVETNETPPHAPLPPTHTYPTHIKKSRNGSLLSESSVLKRAGQASQPVVN